MTTRLYQENVYLKECTAILLEIEELEEGLKAVFDQTVFFPTGGGQLCDTGEISGHKVIKVSEEKESGKIIHFLEKEGENLIQGNSYNLQLDWDKRFSHMQMHCGEHLLSGAFKRLFGASNKGFHMGEDYVTIDIDLDGEMLTPTMIAQAEKLANSWIYDNLTVETRFFSTAEEAMSLPCRKQIKFGEDIYVVLIGDENNPADCCACCGTHPSTTGQIGIIKVTHSEKYKSMTRMYVKCGKRALEDYSDRLEILDRVAKKYSCDIHELENALEAAEGRNEELYKKYSNMKKQLMESAQAKLVETISDSSDKDSIVTYYDQFDLNDLQDLTKNVEIPDGKLVVLVCKSASSCILVSSGNPDCGKLVKEKAFAIGGKGGGKPTLARAVFADEETLKGFVSRL